MWHRELWKPNCTGVWYLSCIICNVAPNLCSFCLPISTYRIYTVGVGRRCSFKQHLWLRWCHVRIFSPMSCTSFFLHSIYSKIWSDPTRKLVLLQPVNVKVLVWIHKDDEVRAVNLFFFSTDSDDTLFQSLCILLLQHVLSSQPAINSLTSLIRNPSSLPKSHHLAFM